MKWHFIIGVVWGAVILGAGAALHLVDGAGADRVAPECAAHCLTSV